MLKLHVGDVGTYFITTVKDENANAIDISTATSKIFTFKKPDSSNVLKTAIFQNDGSDGILQYVTVSGDLDTHGNWSLQAHIITPLEDFKTDIYDFRVERNIL